MLYRFFSVNGINGFFCTAAVGLINQLVVVYIFKLQFGIGKNKLPYNRCYFRAFPPCRFQKFSACGNVVKQVSHPDACARVGGKLPFGFNTSRLYLYLRACFVAFRFCKHFHNGNGGYACQSLASEAESFDFVQILRQSDFTCCMRQKCDVDIVFFYTATVVNNIYKVDSAVFNGYFYIFGARVDAVFHKLLDYGRRSFHYLSGGNFVVNIA